MRPFHSKAADSSTRTPDIDDDGEGECEGDTFRKDCEARKKDTEHTDIARRYEAVVRLCAGCDCLRL